MLLVRRLACLISVILAPLAIAEIYNTTSLMNEELSQIGASATRQANVLSDENDRLALGVEDLLFAASLDADRAATDPRSCRRLMDGLSARGGQLRIRILDANAVTRCAEDRSDDGTWHGDEPEVATVLRAGGAVAGSYEFGPFDEDGRRRIAMACRDGPDGPRGAITADLKLSAVADTLRKVRLAAGADMVVLDGAGRVLGTAGADGATPSPDALPFAARLGAAIGTPVRLRWLDGSDRIAVARRLGAPRADAGTPVAVVGISVARRIGPLRAALQRSLALLLITWVVSTALAVAMGHALIARPIRTLEDAVRRWRDGDRQARALLPGRTELTQLGRAFDAMADVTAAGERQLRDGSEFLRRLVAAIPDAVFVQDPGGRMLLSNETFDRLVESGIRAMDAALVSAVAARREILTGEQILAGRDGVARTFQIVYAPLFSDGGALLAVAGIGRDLTGIRRAEDALRNAKEEAEAANRSKTRFLASASHDLRQPVQGALLYAEAALARSAPSAEATPALRRCVQALTDMSGLLDGLLDLSRLDAGLAPANVADVPLQPLLEEVIAASRIAAEGKGLRIDADGTAAVVRSDRLLLARMLNNLVANAVRYTNEGEIRITVDQQESCLQVLISDTGIGIPKASLDTIFEEFHQLHNPERDRSRGLGLGLSIVQRLSRLLAHEVRVVSELGRGSTFSVAIPLVPSGAQAADRAGGTEPRGARTGRDDPGRAGGRDDAGRAGGRDDAGRAGGREGERRHALVIDDDRTLLEGIGWVLGDHGLSVSLAEDGEAAVAAAAERRPDIVLADFRLRAGERGSMVIDRVRAEVGCRVPALLLTGESGGDVRREAARIGVAVVMKPARPAQIMQAIARALDDGPVPLIASDARRA